MHRTSFDDNFSERPGLLGWFVLAALLLHSVLFYSVEKLELKLPSKAYAPPQIVELFKDERQVVQSLQRDDGSDAKAKFRSDARNRVAEETRATRRGQYQDRNTARAQRDELPADKDGLSPKSPRDLSLKDLTQLAQSPHEVDKAVREGDQTMLNTDSVYYASFMNRITDAIYPAWMRHLRAAGEALKLDRNPSAIDKPAYITRLSVEMDSSGNILSVQVIKSSGIREFDDAPKAAIWDKEPFRNPPSQMFADNQDTFKFEYVFTVEMQKSFFSIFPQVEL